MTEAKVIQFPVREITVLPPVGNLSASVEVDADGGVVVSPGVTLDEASKAFWRAVEAHVLGAWKETALPKARMQVRLLTTYLDKTDPKWRTKVKDMLDEH